MRKNIKLESEYVEIRLHDSGKLEICESADYGPGIYTHYGKNEHWNFITSKNNEAAIIKATKKMFSYLTKNIEKDLIPLRKKLATIKRIEKSYTS